MKKIIFSVIFLGLIQALYAMGFTNIETRGANTSLSDKITGDEWQRIRYGDEQSRLLKNQGYYTIFIAIILIFCIGKYVVVRQKKK